MKELSFYSDNLLEKHPLLEETFCGTNSADRREYGAGQMMIAGDIITTCTDNTNWVNFRVSEENWNEVVDILESLGFRLVA